MSNAFVKFVCGGALGGRGICDRENSFDSSVRWPSLFHEE
jgi:hypothetical protein